MKIKLSTWAKQNDMSYMSAWRMVRDNRFPLLVEILATGTILVEIPDKIKSDDTITLYARVSSHDQKNDLHRQMQRLRDFAASSGKSIKQEVSEIGSGLNGKRPKLIKILSGTSDILVEHRDRLCRFGFDYIEAVLKSQGRSIIVINETENKMDLVQDFVDVVTSMCARIYGTRSARNRAERAVVEASKE